MGKLKILLLLIIVALAIAAGCWLKREFAIDSCLDLGGRWDYKAAICEYSKD